MTGLLAGIDEAGRGPIIGPMVIAGVKADENVITKWKVWGVRDSKKVPPTKREMLYRRLTNPFSGAIFHIVRIHPAEIDMAVRAMDKNKRLNYLEAVYFAKVVDAIGDSQTTFYVDAPDVNATRFGNVVFNMQTRKPRSNVIGRHHADRDFTVVGAASILAKVTRDRDIADLRKKVGVDFGSGYPSDIRTRLFVKGLLADNQPLPSYIRQSWRTLRRLEYEVRQPSLSVFKTSKGRNVIP